MDSELVRHKKKEIVKRFGLWTAHNIRLCEDVYTIDKRVVGDEIRLRRVIQIISDISAKPIRSLRILDLACLEGLFAIELAQRGAKVVAIEGRQANIEKARFVKEVLSLNNLEVLQDDVRNLSEEKYGKFDVVLCLGILYHLGMPDVFYFLERMAEVCSAFAIIDTEVTPANETSYAHRGREYWGKIRVEHHATSTSQDRAGALWASLDNLDSFCFTRPSLWNILSHVGFTSVYECHNPRVEKGTGRTTLCAIKGVNQRLLSVPLANSLPEDNWPERGRMYANAVRIARLLPRPIQRAISGMFLRQ